jgi:hypothetical protein
MHIQALPFRGCTRLVPRKEDSRIVSLESAWHKESGNLKKALLRLLTGDQALLWVLRDASPVPVVIETHPLARLRHDIADVRDRIKEELDE